MTPTIGWAMIVRNAEPCLEKALESIKGHIDQLVVVLAGESTDKTEEIARRYTDEVYSFDWVDDFAAARNFSFSKLTTDWLGWSDADDIVINAAKLRQVVTEAEQSGLGCVHFTYNYRHDNQGRPTVIQTRERLMKASIGWQWKDRVHEYCAGLSEHAVGFSNDVVIDHLSEEPNRERNLRLLHLMEQEDPNNWRMLGALGDTYQSMGEFGKAIEYNTRFFLVVGNQDAKWTAATELARAHIKLESWQDAEQWCFAAISVNPSYALPFLLLAHIYWYGHQDSEKALRYLADADTRDEAPLVIYRQPNDYGLNRWDVEHRLLADQGRWQESLAIVGQAIEYLGGSRDNTHQPSQQWRYFWWYYLERINCEKSVRAAYDLVNHLFARGDTLAAREVLRNLPVSIRGEPRIVALGREVEKATCHVFDEKDYEHFYSEEHPESHETNGIGMEIYRMEPLAKRLRARGAKRILDIGCGAGGPAIWLAEQGFYVVGIDINPKVITAARREAKKRLGTNGKNLYRCEFRRGTLDTLGPEDLGRFDAVVMMELIEHIHPSKVPFYLASAEDFLEPGGAVFITTPAMLVGDIPGVGKNFPRDHVKEYTQQDLESLLANYPGRRVKLPITLHKVMDTKIPIPGFGTWFLEYECHTEEQWQTRQPENWDKPVVIYCGPGLEEWTPETPEERGLGGSETWAIQTAKELRRRGHPVAVYGAVNGYWDGVVCRHASMFNPEAPFGGERAWLCIVSRYLQKLDTRPNAEHVLFVAHDVDYGEELTKERLDNMDQYCVLSNWQFRHTAEVYGDLIAGRRVGLLSNGIDPSFFDSEEDKVPHSFIWSSSPDRGLDQLLEWWPHIRTLWPDATLSIYYGWNNVNGLLESRPWLASFKEKVQTLARQPGVSWKGRIGQRGLAKEMAKAQFWVYPSKTPFGTDFHETFCITALEAQMAGCIPIMPAVGALAERFYYGGMPERLDLAEVIEYLQSWDRIGLSKETQEAAKATIAEYYSWQAATDRLLSVVGSKVEVVSAT